MYVDYISLAFWSSVPSRTEIDASTKSAKMKSILHLDLVKNYQNSLFALSLPLSSQFQSSKHIQFSFKYI